MAKVDLEARLLQLTDVVRNNINTKIAEINAEKSDDVVMQTIGAAAFEYQDMGFNKSPNYSPMVFFNIECELGPTIGREVQEKGRVIAEIVTSDQSYAGSSKILKLLARYRRALREVILDNWQTFNGAVLVSYLPDAGFTVPAGMNFYSVAVKAEINLAS